MQKFTAKLMLEQGMKPQWRSRGSLTSVLEVVGARGGVVVKALRYKLAGRGSIPDGVIGIFQ